MERTPVAYMRRGGYEGDGPGAHAVLLCGRSLRGAFMSSCRGVVGIWVALLALYACSLDRDVPSTGDLPAIDADAGPDAAADDGSGGSHSPMSGGKGGHAGGPQGGASGRAGGGESGSDSPGDGECATTCDGDTPVCDAASGRCVTCTESHGCSGEKPFCDVDGNQGTGECVACLANSDCWDERPRCDQDLGQCVACISSEDCPELPLCDGDEHIGACTCPPGWMGLGCQQDSDECAADSDDCSSSPEACINFIGSYECRCPRSGYSGDGHGQDGCEDLDECAMETDRCDDLVSCVNSRLEDLEAAARVIRGRRVAHGVSLYVAAASREIQEQAERSGAWGALVDAGARVLPPGCGPCIGLGEGLLEAGVGEDEPSALPHSSRNSRAP